MKAKRAELLSFFPDRFKILSLGRAEAPLETWTPPYKPQEEPWTPPAAGEEDTNELGKGGNGNRKGKGKGKGK